MYPDIKRILNEFPDEFRTFLAAYAHLEQDIQHLMQANCQQVCALCPATCCRYDICEETIESPFLSLLQKLFSPDEFLDESYGWLGTTGCLLKCGRPPVCYGFFCDELLAFFKDDMDRYVIKTLGKLLSYVGERALGERHLVEIMDITQLKRINTKRMIERLQHAHQAYEHIQHYCEHTEIPEEGWQLLNRIRPATC